MKRVYSLLPAICICIMAGVPRIALAQCTCSGGVPATAIAYSAVLPPNTASISTVSFPKFNPAIGNLTCVGFLDSITAVSITHVWNKASTKTKYKFDLVLNNDIEGPGGISNTSSFDHTYGPDSLDAAGLPGDSITYGPDSLYVGNVDTSGTSVTAPFLGTVGTADFTYTINGGLLSLLGSTNYGDSITTVYSGVFRLTYFWCPAIILSTTIEDFTAVPNGNALLLEWTAGNEQNNTSYEIQISTDGAHFTDIGQTESNPPTVGATAKYQYQYHPDPAALGRVYFRLRQVTADGKVSYSKILVISPNGQPGAPISYHTFPNPASNSLVFQFNDNQTGRFMLELVNTAGQVILQKAVTLTGTSQIMLDLSPHPVRGLYYLRTRDLTHDREYLSKVLIN
jgi:hypothetical protein